MSKKRKLTKQTHGSHPSYVKLEPELSCIEAYRVKTSNKITKVKEERFAYSDKPMPRPRRDLFSEQILKCIDDTAIPLPSEQLLDIVNNFASLKATESPNLIEKFKSNTLFTFGVAVQEYISYLIEPLVEDFIIERTPEQSIKKVDSSDAIVIEKPDVEEQLDSSLSVKQRSCRDIDKSVNVDNPEQHQEMSEE